QATEPGEQWLITPSPTDSLSVGATTDSSIAFTLWFTAPTSRHRFSHHQAVRVGRNCNVTVFVKQPVDSAAGLPVAITLSAQVQLRVPQPDTYQFHFWRSDTASLDTAIAVP
ncbi:MAG: hypothetical protein MUF78_10315, partial [Candidatus Edwardsbacteria bacterium]|nr:hypothetical protein [Candidatus Edwardsbacteria bacterium]